MTALSTTESSANTKKDIARAALRAEYEHYLRHQRGLSERTIFHSWRFADRFLSFRFGEEVGDVSEITSSDIVAFLQHLATRNPPLRDKTPSTHLRNFFRYVFKAGKTSTDLSLGIPSIAQRYGTRLPRHLSPDQVEAVIGAVRTDMPRGRRNHAMVLLLARLGLRSVEVAAMQIDDIDWRSGELIVRGKGQRYDRVPLPADVGKALVDYIQHDRVTTSRALFVTERAPHRPFTGGQILNTILKDAFAAIGLEIPAPYVGSHILRHSLAANLVQRGASLEEIGDMLRHRSRASTMIYARLDIEGHAAFDRTTLAGRWRCAMSTLPTELDRYLLVRRSLGYDLGTAERILRGFVAFAERRGATHVGSDLFLAWRDTFGRANRQTWAARLRTVRLFAQWLHGIDPNHAVPPRELIPGRYRRARPYIYSEDEIRRIVEAAAALPSVYGLRALTCSTLFGLVAVTGLRISEALSLGADDIDFDAGVLTLRRGKLGKFRLLPLSESATAQVLAYSRERDRLLGIRPKAFFVAESGKRVTDCGARYNFASVCQTIGLRPPEKFKRHGHGPRIHDLRHTFAVRTLLRWYRTGQDPAQEMIKLTTYLGHADPAHTYWYIEAVPELLDLASRRAQASMAQEVQS